MYYASHQAIQPFSLHRPATAQAAVAARTENDDASYLAGGVDLIPAMRAGARPAHLIWLKDIPGLADIVREGDMLRIGAAATYRQVEVDPIVQGLLPGLSDVWTEVANIRVRLAGSIGGNIMMGNPAYDALPAMIALGAKLGFAVADGVATVDAGEAIPPGALLMDIQIPLGSDIRFSMDRTLKPTISLALSVRQTSGGWTARAAVGCAHEQAWGADVGTVDDLAQLAAGAEQLARRFTEAMPEPLSNHNGSAAYRRRMAGVLLARQLKELAA